MSRLTTFRCYRSIVISILTDCYLQYRNSITFAVNVDANTHHLIEPRLLVGSLSDLHTILKAEKRLSKKDITNGVLSLRVFLYEKVQVTILMF